MNDKHLWPIFAGEIIRALAYVIAAAAVGRLSRTPMVSSLGNLRWPFVALLATIASLQLVVLAGRLAGCLEVSEFASLVMAILVLAAALLLWPFLGFVGRRLSRQTASKLRWRLRQARAQALQSRRWLELGEELAHVGHWTIEMPDYRVFWSDEAYRIHGLPREDFKLDFVSAFSVLSLRTARRCWRILRAPSLKNPALISRPG